MTPENNKRFSWLKFFPNLLKKRFMEEKLLKVVGVTICTIAIFLTIFFIYPFPPKNIKILALIVFFIILYGIGWYVYLLSHSQGAPNLPPAAGGGQNPPSIKDYKEIHDFAQKEIQWVRTTYKWLIGSVSAVALLIIGAIAYIGYGDFKTIEERIDKKIKTYETTALENVKKEINDFTITEKEKAIDVIKQEIDNSIKEKFSTDEKLKKYVDKNVNKELVAKALVVLSGEDVVKELVPVGTIVPYYGNLAPSGWLLCDGRKVTELDNDTKYSALKKHLEKLDMTAIPDLRGRFPLGLDSNNKDYSIGVLGKIGGEFSHKLIDNEIPPHRHLAVISDHLAYDDTHTTGVHGIRFMSGNPPRRSYSRNWPDIEDNEPHNNMPPYITVNYIIKY